MKKTAYEIARAALIFSIPFFLKEKRSPLATRSSPRKMLMRVLLPKATGRIAAVFKPMIPSAKRSTLKPVANAMIIQIGVPIDNGTQRIIAGRMDNVKSGVNWK